MHEYNSRHERKLGVSFKANSTAYIDNRSHTTWNYIKLVNFVYIPSKGCTEQAKEKPYGNSRIRVVPLGKGKRAIQTPTNRLRLVGARKSRSPQQFQGIW
jgi:hypothetical protein